MTEVDERASEQGSTAGGPSSAARHCRWCRRVLPQQIGRGRPRKFCSQRCRQWDWVARQRARELELSDTELVIVRAELDSLHDDLYVLACAVEDAERDLDATQTVISLRETLNWLLDAARPLRDRELAPSGGAGDSAQAGDATTAAAHQSKS